MLRSLRARSGRAVSNVIKVIYVDIGSSIGCGVIVLVLVRVVLGKGRGPSAADVFIFHLGKGVGSEGGGVPMDNGY